MIRTAVVLILVIFAGVAWAHSWYPKECCSDRDSAELAAERVKVTPNGYVIDGRELIPFSKAQASPDEKFHACFPATMLGKVGCFWAPQGAT